MLFILFIFWGLESFAASYPDESRSFHVGSPPRYTTPLIIPNAVEKEKRKADTNSSVRSNGENVVTEGGPPDHDSQVTTDVLEEWVNQMEM